MLAIFERFRLYRFRFHRQRESDSLTLRDAAGGGKRFYNLHLTCIILLADHFPGVV